MGPKSTTGDQSGGAFNKRKTGPPANNARSDAFTQKRAKVYAARNIPTQPAEVALKDGQLDLAAFVAAHEFEIRALEQSMATTKAVSSTRAFQMVPRGLRRRTASHNPKRVPKRLRAQAKREMEEDNAPLVEARRRKPRTTRAKIRAQMAKRLHILAARKRRKKEKQADKQDGGEDKEEPQAEAVVGRKPRPKIRRNMLNEPPKPAAKFRKRQINKTWLPTHRWHAKRARMTDPKNPLWRFAIPLTPNEKIYRPTHRAQGERGTMVWDMSYMSTIGLYGNLAGMTRVLKRVGVRQDSCWNDRGKKWRQGTRAWTGILRREDDEGDEQPMCPSAVFWNPEPTPTEENRDEKKVQRQVYLRVHPSAFLEVFDELVRLTKMENPRLYIEDLRFEIGSIEFTGPASTEALLAILAPYPSGTSPPNKHAELFQSLKGLSNPAALPTNAVLNFQIQDPRLRYPPRRVDLPQGEQAQLKLMEAIAKWPAEENLQPSALFDRDARHRASCIPPQKSINRRRSKANPGAFLKPNLLIDPPIPITLLASRSGSNTQTQGIWTLLAPWNCILPLWYSIVHTPLSSGNNPRFAGLNETMQVAFERGLPWFPADAIGTHAGAQWELVRRRKRRWEWAKRPKSKRVEWGSLDLGAARKGEVGDGFACDFEFLFGLPKLQGEEVRELPDSDDDEDEDEDDDDDAMDVDGGALITLETQAARETESSSLKILTSIPKSDFNALLSPSSPRPSIPPNTLVCVRISVLGRGVVTSCARIYRLPAKHVPVPTCSNAEVPASIPPPSLTPHVPYNLRAQWLARVPSPSSSRPARASRATRVTDMEMRKRLLAQELIERPPRLGTETDDSQPNLLNIGGIHPVVPDPKDLVGFVTSGSFSLADGRGAAIGSIAVEKVLLDVKRDAKEGRLCIVRNAGENVGWMARWDVI
ncbi:Ribonucleases P/MRP subunit pop1-like protein [Cladobotryum mycophilum]|uniref:Ribonucleases P/MRP subunit pop1-like protein n=1 Tax=Cladobotryum mycophilum TaxID=491253 RepID=A0ABR0T4F2_9HYPO